jgi:hypothetical protein
VRSFLGIRETMTNTPPNSGLAEALAGLVAKTDRICTVSKLLLQLDPKMCELLQSALDNPGVSNNSIRTALMVDGIRMSRDSISDHRNGRCICGGNK